MLDDTLNARGSGGVEGDSSTTEKNDTRSKDNWNTVVLVATYSPIGSIDARLGGGIVIK